MQEKILVFIPTYCCESQIVRVIEQFDVRAQQLIDTIIVIDNQSPDCTLDVAIKHGQAVINRCNFIVWRNDENYGLGGSHKVAFRYAIEKGFDYMVVFHGDDQASFHDLILKIESGEHLEVDCLLGARFMPGSVLKGYSLFRTLGNLVYNALFSSVFLKKIYDLGSGLNMYRLSAFRCFYYHQYPDDLTFNYVMLMANFHRKQSIRFFPITWREEDQISNVKLFRQALRVMGFLAGFCLCRGRFLKREFRSSRVISYAGNVVYHHDRSIK